MSEVTSESKDRSGPLEFISTEGGFSEQSEDKSDAAEKSSRHFSDPAENSVFHKSYAFQFRQITGLKYHKDQNQKIRK